MAGSSKTAKGSAKGGKSALGADPEMKLIQDGIYSYFNVSSVQELKKSGSFRMATDGMDKPDMKDPETWKKLYRRLVGVIPSEKNATGPTAINGVDVLKYFKPWQVFGLDPQVATKDDIKKAYHKLSMKYHPDMPNGDRRVFEALNTMYRSITAY